MAGEKLMNTEQITQIIETIKTLNLNVDSQSAIQIVEMLKPVMYAYIGADILKDVFFIQDEITKKVLASLQVKLTIGQDARIWAKSTTWPNKSLNASKQ